MPTLSIIIPVFNTQKNLPACLDSILAQGLEDMEVLCVDDGSPDDSLSVLRRYAQADPRVHVLRHERNRGVSAARNTGMQTAAGEYTAFVDSDDTLAPDFCERLLAAAHREGADIAKGNYAYLGYSGINYSINARIREHKTNFYIQFCSAIYRTALLRESGIRFPEQLHVSEDIVFAFSVALRARRIAIDDMAHINVNTRRGSASFAAPSYADIISHYRALGMITQLATQNVVSAASFNYVLASLFVLFVHIAVRNRRASVRRFIEAKNRQLFKLVRTCPKFDAGIFAGALEDADKHLLACLENNELSQFFAALDKLRAQRCRMLRSRP
ncbi:hypothetical protein HMPREF0326_02220 [Desulfovibrio sp. 3_1_syn3]|uniref:glycosyltransferase family 2 protein n=1 Tax=Desulfovibrio sp. 3_1_syn3 TaxID=457398 RepID=UPI00038F7864|nr:glycosyltransferase [Desulfovibrio sp. 3_1_syn3]EFL85468.2 hypothetical protein HMPREF0326_02220 [Desulfovibrio sp. 3_1_syn3]